MRRVRRLPRVLGVLAVVTAAIGLLASPSDSQTAAAKKGGVLRVGTIGEPPTLYAHATTAVITREIGINIFEGLDARRKEVQGYEPGPYMHFWNVWLDKR